MLCFHLSSSGEVERSGSVGVGDRVVGVNGQSVLRVNYENVLQLIDDAPSPVRLSFASPSLLPAGTIAIAGHGRAIATRGRSRSEGSRLSPAGERQDARHGRARASSTGNQQPTDAGEPVASK